MKGSSKRNFQIGQNMNNSTHDDVFIKECVAVFGRASKIIVRFSSDLYVISSVLVVAINSLLIIPTIVLNAVSVAAITKSTRLSSKPCYFLVVIQSLVDLTVGAVGIPILIFSVASPMVGFQNCTVDFLVIQFLFIPSGISILTLSAMTIERYIGVLHPYAYSTKVTKKRILIYECCVILLITLLVGVSLPVQSVITNFSIILILLFFILNTFVYTRIYIVVLKIARSDKIQNNAREENSTKRQKFLSEIKQAKSCFLVLMCFVICFLPLLLGGFFKLNGLDHMVYQTWSITFVMLNSSANSVIFFWTKKELRVQALQVFNRRTVAPA